MLAQEFPRLKVFCTLSPVPAFAAWLAPFLESGDAKESAPFGVALQAVRKALGTNIAAIASDPDGANARLASIRKPLTQLCATYLLQRANGDAAQDPVKRFHLNNGARLERINWLADSSKKGLAESLGLMVNYLYEPGSIEVNHENFVHGEIVASRRVRGMELARA